MRRPLSALPVLGLLSLLAGSLLAGCTGGESVGFDQEPLRMDATDYPEAVLVDALADDGTGAACSGAVIAPKVVLTAGHCILGYTSWSVTAPGAKDSSAVSAEESGPGDYSVSPSMAASMTVNPAEHDVGLIFLDRAIDLDVYPGIAQSPDADGSYVVTLGRREQVGGAVSDTEVFASSPFQIEAVGPAAPFDYKSSIEIDHGDSGGPVIDYPASPHVILAVNSGGLSSGSEYARVDLVYAWIHEAILAHGGPGKS